MRNTLLAILVLGIVVSLALVGGLLSAPKGSALGEVVVQVNGGALHTCAVVTPDSLMCWGWNEQGQLGIDTLVDQRTPVPVPGLPSGVASIFTGSNHTCGLTTSGGVKCWGVGTAGQLGNGVHPGSYQSAAPVDVVGLTIGVAYVGGGQSHTCAVTSGGAVKCWGFNFNGQLGDGSTDTRYTPVDVTGLTSGVIAVTGGYRHTCALLTGGGVKCWGQNTYGQLGDGTNADSNTPVDVVGLTDVVALTSYSQHTCALTSGGAVKCWGWNLYGQLATGNHANQNTPVDVGGIPTDITSVAVGYGHTCAASATSGVKCWGDNFYGQLGDGTTTESNTPVSVVGISGGVEVVGGGSAHTCAVTAADGLKCWGWNERGQLGNATVVDSSTPVTAQGLGPKPNALTPSPTPMPMHKAVQEVKKLVAANPDDSDKYGRGVAISGDTAIVGVINDDDGGINAGAVYVLERDEGGSDNWGEVKKLLASDAKDQRAFGLSVALDGDTVVVGAYRDDAGGFDAGAAYVYQRNQGGPDNWGEVKKVTASDPQEGDNFGWSVAVSGDVVIVGAKWEESPVFFDRGAAYVFHRDAGGLNNWGEVKKLIASDPESFDNFGSSVAVSGDTAVVGADEWVSTIESGQAYVFQRDQGGSDNWGEVKKLTASDAYGGQHFGRGVAAAGDTIIVGAPEDFASLNPGAAYAYQRDEGGLDNWGEVAKLTASDAEPRDNFGSSIAMSGDTAVVGAIWEDSGGLDAGAAYVLQRDAGGLNSWGEVKKLGASDAEIEDNFGISVAVSGNDAMVGAWTEDAAGTNAGAAYVYYLQLTLPDPGDTDGDGCSDARENGPDETLGGLRDYKNPYDFYDVRGPGAALPVDGVIDLPNDILTVILGFSPLGLPPYDASLDRGVSSGPNAWNMTASDGVIDLPNDILGVILQFDHDCT